MKDIEIIAEHYGLEEQSLQCIEEMAELTVAINKVRRHISDEIELVHGRKAHSIWLEPINNMIEEIADVQIMLNQLVFLTNSHEQVEKIMDEKIKRQMERIGMPKDD